MSELRAGYSRVQLLFIDFFLFHFDTLATKDCLIFRFNLRPGSFF